MKARLEDVGQSKKKVIVELEKGEVKQSRANLYGILKHEVTVKGFRKGKASEDMIIRELGDETYKRRFIRQLVSDTYPQAIAKVEGKPISDPEVSAKKISYDGPVTYEATFEIVPTIVAKDYKNIPLTKNVVKVTDDDVRRELKILQRQMMQLEPAPDGVIDDGMIAAIQYKGTADGKPFEGCEAENFLVETDEEGFLKEFIDGIRGMKNGEERTINFVYPKDYFNQEIAGKKAEFLVRVKDIKKKHLPKLDDEFVKNFGSFKNLSEMKDEIKKRLKMMRESQEQARIEKVAAAEVANRNRFDVPAAMVSYQLSQMLEEVAADLAKQGKRLEDVNFNTDEFVRNNYDEALLRAKWYIIGQSISEQEDIQASDDDVENRIKFIAQVNKKKESEIMPKKGSSQWHSLCKSIVLGKALKFVIDNAKVGKLPENPDRAAKKAVSKAAKKSVKSKKGAKK